LTADEKGRAQYGHAKHDAQSPVNKLTHTASLLGEWKCQNEVVWKIHTKR
jgi:hypothetical protein